VALEFSTSENGANERVLTLAGQLDALSASELLPTIDKIVAEKRKTVTVELSGLELIDSSGVAAIVALYKRCKAVGGTVRVVGACNQPLAIFKLLRMDKVFQME